MSEIPSPDEKPVPTPEVATVLPAPVPSRLQRFVGFLWKALLWSITLSIVWVVVLRWVPVPFTSLMLQRSWEGKQGKAADGTIYYHWTPLSRIAPEMAVAVIASEDQNFLRHEGFDFAAIQRAIEENKTRKIKRGASTISQQVAKNVFLWNGRSYVRKGLEVYFTVLIELFWSKERIMEVYLNVAEMGERTFGAEAAARRFFGKSAAALNSYEAARLAAVLPNPRIFSAKNPNWYVNTRQAHIQRQMQLLGGKSYWK